MKRLAASFEVAGRDLGFAPEDRRAIVTACVREYREGMREAATKGTLDVWYSHLNIDELTAWMDAEVSEKRLGKKDETGAARTIAKARTRNSVRVFSKRTGLVGGELRIVRDPPLITPIEDVVLSRPERAETEKSIAQLLRSYRGRGDTFDRAIADFSVAYADQNEQDYEALRSAVKSGRLPAQTGL